MAYKWQYGTVGQRDRLKMIREGDSAVYNAEKDNNGSLRKMLTELGLSTAELDDWDATIDNAYSNAVSKSDRSGLPKFYSSALNSINNAYSKQMKKLNEATQEALDDAADEAESSYNYLSEWLANNGYSDKGSTSKEKKAAFAESFEKLMGQIKEQYRTNADNVRKSFFGPYLG